MHFRKSFCLPVCFFILFLQVSAQAANHSPRVTLNGSLKNQILTGPVSYQVDSSRSSGISRMQWMPFGVSYERFTQLLDSERTRYSFWLKFDLTNQTDSSLQLYFYCGNINFTDIYFIATSQVIQNVPGGNLRIRKGFHHQFFIFPLP